MNSLQSTIVTSPFGKDEECGMFVIDTVQSPFIFDGLTNAGQEYTLSFWVRSAKAASVTIGEDKFSTTTSWTKVATTFIADDAYVSVFFNTATTYYIYHIQMELGNQPTDWTPAPEDVDKAIVDKGEELGQVIVEQSQSAKDAANAYTDEKLNDYVESDDFISFEKDVSARLDVMDENVTISIETLTKQIVAVNNELTTNHNLILKYFEFGENGLVIGVTDNPYKTRIDNDRYSMTMNNVEILYFDGNGKGYIPDLTVDRAFNLLGLRFEKDSNGNLNCEYNGG